METLDLPPHLVFDFGSGYTKCGFSGDDFPRVILPSCVGTTKSRGPLVMDSYVGDEAMAKKGILDIHFPIQRGVITNFEHLEKLIAHCFNKELRVDPMEQALLIADSPVCSVQDREKMMEILFESFGVPALYFELQGVMSMYSCGLVSGTVLDSGKGLTYALPVHEGKPIRNALETIAIGGGDLTQLTYSLLVDSGYQYYTPAERHVAGDIKRKICYVSQDYEKELTEPNSVEYELPDGTKMTFSTLRIKVPEIMFQPHLLEYEFIGVHELIQNSVRNSYIDIRKDLYKNIMVCGGNTMFSGFIERLNKELSNFIPSSIEYKVNDQTGRQYSAWIGGSILASMSTFNEVWADRNAYDESGKSISARFL